MLLFGFIRGPCIDVFHSDLVTMDHVSGGSQRWYIILWDNVIPINRFQHWTQFSRRNPFHSAMTLPWCHYLMGRAHCEIVVELPIRLGSLHKTYCEMPCHCPRAFQLVDHTHRIEVLNGRRCLLHLTVLDDRQTDRQSRRLAVIERQEVSYHYSHWISSNADVQFALQPTRGRWVNWLALFAISNYSPHRCLGNRGIDLSDKEKNVFLVPGWPLRWWMDFIRSELGLLADAAHT